MTRQTQGCFSSAVDLEQARAALAAADAHRDDAPLGLAPAAFLQDVAGETRAGHAEGMADRDRAAVDVVLLRIDAQLVRLAARRRPGDEAAERIEAALLGILGLHQNDRRRTVRELAGIAGGD